MTTTAPKDEKPISGYLAVPLSYFVPGLGHILVGEKTRGILFLVTIHLLFAAGMFIAGVRAINPSDQPIWSYTQRIVGLPWWIASQAEARVPRPDALEAQYRAEFAEKFGQPRDDPAGVLPHPDNRPMAPEERAQHENEVRQAQQRRAEFYAEFVARHPYFNYSPKVQDIGAVYCGIAGMLNLLVMLDVLLRASGSTRHAPEKEATPTPPTTAGGAA